MSKFAVGQLVDNAADDHESGTVVAVFPTVDETSDTLLTWRATGRSSFSPKKN